MDILDFKGTRYIEWADARPSFTGTAASEIGKPGAQALISFGGQSYTVDVDIDGKFTWTAPQDVADGNYSFSVIIRDRAGNSSAPALRTFIVDSTPPEAPELLKLYDDQGEHKGSFESGETTDDKRPTLTGIAQKGTVVFLLDSNNDIIGSAQADSTSGKWTLEPMQDLAEGDNALRLVARENFANMERSSEASSVFHVVIGDDAPPTGSDIVTISGGIDDAGNATGSLTSGALTDDTTPTLHGQVSAGSTVVVYYRLAGQSMWAGSATATVTGENWSWTPDAALGIGKYEFQASANDKSSALFILDIATGDYINARTRIESVYDSVAPEAGFLHNNAITDDSTPTLRGSSEANAVVMIRYKLTGGAESITSVTADIGGNWIWTPEADLANGQWSFSVQPLGASSWSSDFTLVLTGTNGFDPLVDHAIDNAGDDTGTRQSGAQTDDSTPTLVGRASANSLVYIRYGLANGSTQITSVRAEADSNWSWTPTSPLAQGSWQFAVSKDGTSGWKPFDLTITPDVNPTPVITYAYDDFGAYKGQLDNGASTDDATPTLHGFAGSRALVYLHYRAGSGSWQLASVNASADGSWEFTPASNLSAAKYEFLAGNSATRDTSGKVFKLDIVSSSSSKPVITELYDNVGTEQGSVGAGKITDDLTPTLKGTAQANALIKIYNGSTALGSTLADNKGNWEWTSSSNLAKGSYEFTARQVDGSTQVGQTSAVWKAYLGNVSSGFEDFYIAPLGEFNLKANKGDIFNRDSGVKLTIKEVGLGVSFTSYNHANTQSSTYVLMDVNSKVDLDLPAPTDIVNMSIHFTRSHEPITILMRNDKGNIIDSVEVTQAASGIANFSYLDRNASIKTLTIYGPPKPSYGESHIKIYDLRWGDSVNIPIDNSSKTSSIPSAIYEYENDDDILSSQYHLEEKNQTLDITDILTTHKAVTTVDITGSGDNTLKVDLNALLQHGKKDLFIEDGKAQLLIKGDAGDVVQLKDILPEGSDISEWQHQDGTVTVAGVEYQVYSHGDDAELLVQQGVKTELI